MSICISTARCPAAAGCFTTIFWHSLRGPSMKILVLVKVLYKSLCEDLVGILVKSSHEDLVGILVESCQRSLHDLVQVLMRRSCDAVRGLCMILWWWNPFRDPCVISYRSLWDDLVEILVQCCKRPLHDLVILYRSLWEDLEGVLVKSFRCPCMVSYRSSWENLVEILFQSSSGDSCIQISRCSALALVWKFFWDAHRKILSEDLVRSFIYRRSFLDDLLNCLICPGMRFWYEVLMGRHSVVSCAKTNSCSCSSDTVWSALLLFHSYFCLYLVHWFPTRHTIRRLLLV